MLQQKSIDLFQKNIAPETEGVEYQKVGETIFGGRKTVEKGKPIPKMTEVAKGEKEEKYTFHFDTQRGLTFRQQGKAGTVEQWNPDNETWGKVGKLPESGWAVSFLTDYPDGRIPKGLDRTSRWRLAKLRKSGYAVKDENGYTLINPNLWSRSGYPVDKLPNQFK